MRDRGLRGRTIWAPLAAAALSGLVIGGLARLLMRGVVVIVDGLAGFSLAGTVIIIVGFGVLALPAAVTATARPAIRRAGRWATAAVTGLQAARTGLSDAKIMLLAEDGQLWLLAGLITVFAAVVVAHGRLAQYLTVRLAASPRPPGTRDGASDLRDLVV